MPLINSSYSVMSRSTDAVKSASVVPPRGKDQLLPAVVMDHIMQFALSTQDVYHFSLTERAAIQTPRAYYGRENAIAQKFLNKSMEIGEAFTLPKAISP